MSAEHWQFEDSYRTSVSTLTYDRNLTNYPVRYKPVIIDKTLKSVQELYCLMELVYYIPKKIQSHTITTNFSYLNMSIMQISIRLNSTLSIFYSKYWQEFCVISIWKTGHEVGSKGFIHDLSQKTKIQSGPSIFGHCRIYFRCLLQYIELHIK